MTRIFLLFAALLTMAAWKDNAATASSETSPGGIPYTLLHMSDHDDVTIQVAWPTDWAYRTETNKAAPVVGAELILAGGAEGFPAGDVGERFADMNAEGSIYVSVNDHVVGELTFERDTITESVEIANAHLRAPTLEQMWFDRIRDGIAQTMAEAQAQPDHASFDAVRWAVFGEQPLRNALSLDEPRTIKTLSRDDISAWHGATFTRDPEAIVVAGSIDESEAGGAIDALLDDLPAASGTIARDATPDFTPQRILLHIPDAQATNLAFIAPLPSTRMGGELEDLILVDALGGGDQSVLFDAVRTELRASYGFGAAIANYSRDHRILFMNGEVEADKLAEVERAVREAYEGFRADGPQGALDDRKAPFEESFSELADFIVDQAHSELQSALDGFEPGRSLALTDELTTVTDETVMARLSDAFPTADAFIAIAVSPDADAMPGACVIQVPREAAACP